MYEWGVNVVMCGPVGDARVNGVIYRSVWVMYGSFENLWASGVKYGRVG